MRGEARLLRAGEYLIGLACRRLPAEVREERYQEWAAELPAILRDPDTRLAAHRVVRMLGYAAGTIWGTAQAPGRARSQAARMANAVSTVVLCGLAAYIEDWVTSSQGWIHFGIEWFIVLLLVSGCNLACRTKRAKRLG